eukprot:COSAG06_NODE_8532_length_2137_cov_2.604024_2_plen_60_part_00
MVSYADRQSGTTREFSDGWHVLLEQAAPTRRMLKEALSDKGGREGWTVGSDLLCRSLWC